MQSDNRPTERIQRIDIDPDDCIRCYACCPGGCVEVPSIFAQPDDQDSIPALQWPREQWVEEQIVDGVFGCPTSAISVTYETYRLTADGSVPHE